LHNVLVTSILCIYETGIVSQNVTADVRFFRELTRLNIAVIR